ncbi:hypothetical protein S83_023954, partial [Arachis hypogaea]
HMASKRKGFSPLSIRFGLKTANKGWWSECTLGRISTLASPNSVLHSTLVKALSNLLKTLSNPSICPPS